MANPQKENGYNQCAVCEKRFILSDPKTFEFENNKSICKTCWLKVYESWGAERKRVIVFEYEKVKISHAIKWAVWKRDGFACKNCGSQDHLEVDHISPESKGGSLNLQNLQTLCKPCNLKKSNR